KLESREDTTPEAVETRLKVYHSLTEPLVGFYKDKGILIKINGEQGIAEVFEEILTKLKEYGLHNEEK
ncbi:hypothetical protein GWN26_06985, partial [Candidatus Saccharibacteria bacterium]|nr:hypothetical protein [Candidatus Saccharibacteria bacterium]NIV03750.1 hypothetical protein [Calditrichia bacterium]NIS38267.1 hypothetical protein [Candidatus Saccharibacteria bacterium]NIV72047.1 hypothetical protein [Calditrichia bacterium]NIV98895.1 hypothetical protein [Candidatus Saccharibacteria bacterium]